MNIVAPTSMMKHLVISVSHDSSLALLSAYADLIVLDEMSAIPKSMPAYETLYIRSHFSHPSTLPQVFQKEINSIIHKVQSSNPNIVFIDHMHTVEAIVNFEDKWHEYKLFNTFMPNTEILTNNTDYTNFTKPLYKMRISSRGKGVTWNRNEANATDNNWIVQESLSIHEELRIYIIRGKVSSFATIRQSKSQARQVKAIDFRTLTDDEITFSLAVAQMIPTIDIIGIDVARTQNGELKLLEVNRSPGFAKFHELTGINLASILYRKAEIE